MKFAAVELNDRRTLEYARELAIFLMIMESVKIDAISLLTIKVAGPSKIYPSMFN